MFQHYALSSYALTCALLNDERRHAESWDGFADSAFARPLEEKSSENLEGKRRLANMVADVCFNLETQKNTVKDQGACGCDCRLLSQR